MKQNITIKIQEDLLNYISTEEFEKVLKEVNTYDLKKGTHNISEHDLQVLTGIYWTGEESLGKDPFESFIYMYTRSKGFSKSINAYDLGGYTNFASFLRNGLKLLKNS